MQQSYSAYYADLWRRHWWWQVRQEVVLRELDLIASPQPQGATPRRLLDIGCAGGVAFDDWSRYGEVYGIEPDPQLIDSTPHWRERIQQQPFGPGHNFDEQYDVAFMLDVLEHLEDDHGSLLSLKSLLRPGGSAIITVPALMSLWSVHDEVNLHFRRYDWRGFQQKLSAAGFEIRKLEYLFGWSLPLVWLRKWLSPRELSEYRVNVPGRATNLLFGGLTRCENSLRHLTGLKLPAGSSLLAVVQRPATTGPEVSAVAVAETASSAGV